MPSFALIRRSSAQAASNSWLTHLGVMAPGEHKHASGVLWTLAVPATC
jgi:hypothetical protein